MAILHVLWGLLNIALLISAIASLFTGFRLLSKRFGASGIILPLILLAATCQFAQKRTREVAKLRRFQTTSFMPHLADSQLRPRHSTLMDLTTFDLTQSIYMNRKSQSDSIQISIHVSTIGFVSGIYWSPTSTWVGVESNQRLHYVSSGVLEWQLLGISIFKQGRKFDGYLSI